ncbi:cytochrome c [Jannaschia sp. M317]|uniref:c-type cytochrome n=1 Tax=Jannaschia sp. M317 TaxID=2867011 RepID=UPI0021A2D683|nr:cytochrome c [Jannaschia sp. M317]UWQ16647.1 cytochrome c [Jannaschia sp. M317]
MQTKTTALLAATILSIGAAGYAAGHAKLPPEIAARHGMMNLYSLNMGVVGGMARGNVDYDADAAQTAADNLAALGMIDHETMWPAGTSTDDVEGTRALPAIWTDRAGFQAEIDGFAEATQQLQAVAGDGLDALRGGVGAVGRTCGSCHDDYRASAN